MNKLSNIFFVAAAAFAVWSCKGTWLMYDTDQTPVIYFQESLQTHSSSFTFLAVDTINVSPTVYVMGEPSDHDRTFTVSYIQAGDGDTLSTGTVTYPVYTATPGEDFTVGNLVIPAGEVSGKLPITIHRTPRMLEGCYLLVGLKLAANEEFTPCAADSSSTQRILTPEYRYYITDGEPACPTWWRYGNSAPGWNFAWGKFYPQKFRKLLEFYHATEETAPTFFAYCVEHYGYYLDAEPDRELNNSMNNFWRTGSPYMASWAKYIAMPLYEYYSEWYAAHPDDPNFEKMGDENVNLGTQTGWGNPMHGSYAFFN